MLHLHTAYRYCMRFLYWPIGWSHELEISAAVQHIPRLSRPQDLVTKGNKGCIALRHCRGIAIRDVRVHVIV
jgi:hypothetical protein